MNLRRAIAAALALCLMYSTQAGSGKIIKTLPHFLDLEGRHTLHPSLFERDAYQADLKHNPELCSGMRFDVQWKARDIKNKKVRLKLEVKGENRLPRQLDVFETEVPASGFFSKWTGLTIAGEEFKKIGAIQAWRISLWEGDQQLAEQKSFLWSAEPPAK